MSNDSVNTIAKKLILIESLLELEASYDTIKAEVRQCRQILGLSHDIELDPQKSYMQVTVYGKEVQHA